MGASAADLFVRTGAATSVETESIVVKDVFAAVIHRHGGRPHEPVYPFPRIRNPWVLLA